MARLCVPRTSHSPSFSYHKPQSLTDDSVAAGAVRRRRIRIPHGSLPQPSRLPSRRPCESPVATLPESRQEFRRWDGQYNVISLPDLKRRHQRTMNHASRLKCHSFTFAAAAFHISPISLTALCTSATVSPVCCHQDAPHRPYTRCSARPPVGNSPSHGHLGRCKPRNRRETRPEGYRGIVRGERTSLVSIRWKTLHRNKRTSIADVRKGLVCTSVAFTTGCRPGQHFFVLSDSWHPWSPVQAMEQGRQGAGKQC